MSDLKIRPLGDKVVLEVLDEAEQTTGGIFIPDSAREKSQKGKILAVGSGAKNDKGEKQELEVKVGDVVIFEKYRGNDIKVESKEYKILSEKDILGIVE